MSDPEVYEQPDEWGIDGTERRRSGIAGSIQQRAMAPYGTPIQEPKILRLYNCCSTLPKMRYKNCDDDTMIYFECSKCGQESPPAWMDDDAVVSWNNMIKTQKEKEQDNDGNKRTTE